MTSTRSSGLPHLAGLSGLTNLRLNRMDLPCSRCSLWLHAGGTNPGSTACHSLCCAACNSAFPFERQGRLLRSRSISGYFPVHFIPACNLPVYASRWPLPDTTQDSVRGCSLGFTAAAISGDGDQRTCKAQTGSLEAVARLQFPQNVACGFPALRSSAGVSQHCRCYLFKFRFHGQLIFSLNRRPCLPLNGAHVAQEQFTCR